MTCRRNDQKNKYIKDNGSQVFFHQRIKLEIQKDRNKNVPCDVGSGLEKLL